MEVNLIKNYNSKKKKKLEVRECYFWAQFQGAIDGRF